MWETLIKAQIGVVGGDVFTRLKIEKCALGIIISIAPHFICKVKPSDCGITKIRTLRQELGVMCHVFCDAHVRGF
jgi:hypothetical protein